MLRMARIYVDTSFWVARFSKKDANYSDAGAILGALRTGRYGIAEFVSADCLVYEVLNYFNCAYGAPSKNLARQAYEYILRMTTIIPVTQSMYEQALSRYFWQIDKSYSVQDSISFKLMDDLAIPYALSFDHHFRQAGKLIVDSQLLSS